MGGNWGSLMKEVKRGRVGKNKDKHMHLFKIIEIEIIELNRFLSNFC